MDDKQRSPSQQNNTPFQLAFSGFSEDIETIETESEFDGELITVKLPKSFLDTLDKIKGISNKFKGISNADNAPTEADQKREKTKAAKAETLNARQQAIEQGAVMSIETHLTVFSQEDLQHAFDAFSICVLPDGKDPSGKTPGKLENAEEKDLTPATKIQTTFLSAAYTAFLKTDRTSPTFKVYLPEFCRQLKIDPRTYSNKREKDKGTDLKEERLNAILNLAAPFRSLWGRIRGRGAYNVLSTDEYDESSQTITFTSHYFYQATLIATQLNNLKHNELLHSDIINEPPAAVELALRITSGLLRRGKYNEPELLKETQYRTRKDGTKVKTVKEYKTGDQQQKKHKCYYSIPFRTLIDDSPQLKTKIEAVKTTGEENYIRNKRDIAEKEIREHKREHPLTEAEIEAARKKYRQTIPQRTNKILADTFTAAFNIIQYHSDAPTVYKDFTLPTRTHGKPPVRVYIVPTNSTLDDLLIIAHNGKNAPVSE